MTCSSPQTSEREKPRERQTTEGFFSLAGISLDRELIYLKYYREERSEKWMGKITLPNLVVCCLFVCFLTLSGK